MITVFLLSFTDMHLIILLSFHASANHQTFGQLKYSLNASQSYTAGIGEVSNFSCTYATYGSCYGKYDTGQFGHILANMPKAWPKSFCSVHVHTSLCK